MNNKIKCTVSTCKHHDDDCCELEKVVISCSDDECFEKEETICKSFKDDKSKHSIDTD